MPHGRQEMKLDFGDVFHWHTYSPTNDDPYSNAIENICDDLKFQKTSI